MALTETDYDIAEFVTGYLACALWASMDLDTGEPIDDEFAIGDFTADARKVAEDTCREFVMANLADLLALEEEGRDASYAGHDFWLTRNGHGTGFWDRGLGKLGDRLSDSARAYGSEHPLPAEDRESVDWLGG